ncbi:MAG: hypothetical protein U0K38_09395 [Collinsella sp.]|nr:hypothetical protein [Collinsella sp.]
MSVELPTDAEGREIPLDTSELFIADGTKVQALRFEYMYHVSDAHDAWFVCIERTPGEHMTLQTRDVRLAQPDSWKRLLDDLDEAGDARYYEACAYFHRDKDEDGCISCPGGEDGCARIAMRDIAFRISKLRGENDG